MHVLVTAYSQFFNRTESKNIELKWKSCKVGEVLRIFRIRLILGQSISLAYGKVVIMDFGRRRVGDFFIFRKVT